MTRMPIKHRSLMAASCAALGVGLAFPAVAQDSSEVEVRAGGTYSSSPFLDPENNEGSFALNAEIEPRLRWRDETASIGLTGLLRYEQFLERYGSNLTGAAALSASKTASETLQIFGQASYRNSNRFGPDLLFAPVDADLDVDPGIPVDSLDPAFFDQATRVQNVGVNFGARKELSATQALQFDIGASSNWFDGEGLDYRSAEASLGYGQQVSARTAWNVQVGAIVSDYQDRSFGDGVLANVVTGFDFELSETGTLNVGVGAALAEVDTFTGDRSSEVFLVASAEFCERVLLGSLCLSGSRKTRPTALSGASTITAASFSWSRQLGEFSRVNLGLRYSDAKAAVASFEDPLVQRTKVGGATATYTQSIGRNFNLYVSPSVIETFEGRTDRGTNYQVRFGIGYVFGR